MKIKKGDTVIVTAGRDRGRQGKVEKVFLKERKVLIPGVNMYKRHLKRRDEKNPGGIVELPRPMDIGKVALICSSCGKQTRIGYLVSKNEKLRVCRKCGKKI